MLSRSSSRLTRSLRVCNSFSTFTLPDIKFSYEELQPYISAEIMEIHHKKHHQAYVTNLNVASEKLDAAQSKGDIATIIELQQVIKFNGGGHINHSIFWNNLAPPSKGGGELPDGELKSMIQAQFGSLDQLQTTMNAKSVGVQGSGWGWLGYDGSSKKLVVTTTANQDPLLPTTGIIPLLGIDVWEHAYYLQYKNVRPDYLKNIWHVVNWKDVAERLAAAKK